MIRIARVVPQVALGSVVLVVLFGWQHFSVSKQLRDLRMLARQSGLPTPLTREETRDECRPGWLTEYDTCHEDAVILNYGGDRTSLLSEILSRNKWKRLPGDPSDQPNEVKFAAVQRGVTYCASIHFGSIATGTVVYMSASSTACGRPENFDSN